MPLYEYECDACGHRFEIIQKFSDGPPDTCPQCGKGPLQRLQSSPAIQFKGTGWYVTDYAGKGKGSGEKGSGEKGSGEKGSGEKGSGEKSGGESKPADGKSDTASADTGTKSDTKKSDAPASPPASKD